MTRIGKSMRENDNLLTLCNEGSVEFIVHYGRRNRLISRRHRFSHCYNIGTQSECFGAKHVAGPAESADYLVDYKQQIVFLEHPLNLIEVANRRHDHAAGAHD